MTDREKVIKGLECLRLHGDIVFDSCEKCPWGNTKEGCLHYITKEAIALLKAQEPKLVHVTANINHRKIGECPTCGKMINSGDYPNYCGRCGQAVKLE